MPKVSIVVPMYNVEQYVKKCLDSLSRQTYQDIKIYAVSDGSPDNSYEIAKTCAKKDPRIICIEKANGGYGSVLEYAIQKITTKYFLVCDPDDWLADNAVETLVTTAEKDNLDLVVADKYYVYQDSEETVYCSSGELAELPPRKVVNKPANFSLLAVSPHAKLFRTTIAKNIDFSKKVNHTDLTLYLVSLAHANRAMYLSQPLAYYLIDRPGNSVTDRSLKSLVARLTVWQNTYRQLPENTHFSYRLLVEFKKILQLYSNNVKNLTRSDFYKEIQSIYHLLRTHRRDVLSLAGQLSAKSKLDVFLVLYLANNPTAYLTLRRLFSKSWRYYHD